MAASVNDPRNDHICLGCGVVINNASDRRNLCGNASQNVSSAWKGLLKAELEGRGCGSTFESLFSADGELLTNYGNQRNMCRKCFYSYERMLKTQEVMQSNLKKIFQYLNISSGHSAAQNRRRSSSSTGMPPTKRPAVSQEGRSPGVVVNVAYEKGTRCYPITPSRKPVVKAYARKSKKKCASESLKDPATRRYILKKLLMWVNKEMQCLCSDKVNSFMRTSELSGFSWDGILQELKRHAPLFLAFMQACMHTKKPRNNSTAVLGMCTAMLLKHTYSEMSLVQKVLSLVLYAGKASKQVFQRLQRVNVTVSHASVIRLLNKFGDCHDKEVTEWSDALKQYLTVTEDQDLLQLQLNADSIGAHGPSTVADSDDDLLSDSGDEQLNDDSYSSSDESTHSVEAPPYSPIVMDGTDSEDEDFDVDLCIASDSMSPYVLSEQQCTSGAVERPVVAQPTIRDVRVPVVPGSASEESAREGVVNTQVPTMDEPLLPYVPSEQQHTSGAVERPIGESFSTPTLMAVAEANFISLEMNEPFVAAQPTIRDVRVPVVPGSASEESGQEDVVNTQAPTMDEPSLSIATTVPPLSFKLVIDNIDMTVKTRFMRVEKFQNQSLHYVNSYGVQSRINHNHLPDVHPDSCMNCPQENAKLLLPSAEDDRSLRNLFITHVARIVTTHMKYFKFSFDDVVEWHVKHQHYKEMSMKSKVVPLGVLLKNENCNSDMVDILSHFHQYVPSLESIQSVHVDGVEETVEVPQALLHKVLLGGDQLTVARARGATKSRINSPSPLGRLAGFIPCVEDWHTQTILLEVIWKYFYSSCSAREHATLCQLRNLINRTNVSGVTKGKFNSTDDFFVLVISCHVLVAAMEYLGMTSLEDTPAEGVIPNVSDVWTLTNDQRKDLLESVCAGIVDKHISFQYNGTTASNVDQVYEYSRQLLSVGCFYLEFADAIREGDGDRVHQCWKYLLPLFKGSNRTNYSIEALTFLNQCEFKLTPRQSEELKWSRFINCHGIQGRNIPCDLHLEHMNRLCKDAVHGLQANKTAISVVRVGKSLGRLSEIVETYDDGNDIQAPSGSHRIPAANKDRDLILRELLTSKVFSSGAPRRHASFPRPRVWMKSFDNDTLITWMTSHMD